MYRLLTDQERVKLLREASDVQRLHSIRTIGEYSNGQHSFNMLAMLRLLWSEAPIELVWAILEHDIPERLIGDVPSPALREVYYESKVEVSNQESEILEEIFGYSVNYGNIPTELQQWLKALDLLELYLYCRDQMAMGNKNVFQVQDRAIKALEALQIPKQIYDLYLECKRSDWTHMPDLGV